MRKTKRILAVFVALAMALALMPTVAFAAELEKPNYTAAYAAGGIKITPTAASGYAFYYTAGSASVAAPSAGDAIGTITGATVMSGETIIPASGDALFYVQIYKVETSGSTITGFEEVAFFTTLTAGSIYTGTIDVRDNGASAGTFSYVYSPNLWTQSYLLTSIKNQLSAPYAALLNPTGSDGFVATGWYANYSTTGNVTVNPTAVTNQASWRSVEDITENILSANFQNATTGSGRTATFEYLVSARNAYEVLPDGTFQKAEPAPQYPVNVAYTIYESTADATVEASSGYPVTQNPGTYSGSGNAVAKIDGPYNEFVQLLLGGNTVAASNYTVTDGSTIITLNESYVKTLAAGTHTFRAVFLNGYANFTVTIEGESESKTKTKPDLPPPIVGILSDVQKSGDTFSFKVYIANASGNMPGATVTVRLNEKYSTTVTIGEDGVGFGTIEAPGYAWDTIHISTRPNMPGAASVGTAYQIYSDGRIVRR